MTPRPSDIIDPQRIALGIQQPWAELIVRGIKSIEVRSQPTRVRGSISIYASKRVSSLDAARVAIEQHRLDVDRLPKGLLVGTVDVVDCRPCLPADAALSGVPAELLVGQYAWILANHQRFAAPVPVRFLPYGVWFYPFRRRTQEDASHADSRR